MPMPLPVAPLVQRRAVGGHIRIARSSHIDWWLCQRLLVPVAFEGERRNPTTFHEIDFSAVHGAQSPSGAFLTNPEVNDVLRRLVEKPRSCYAPPQRSPAAQGADGPLRRVELEATVTR